MLQTGPRKRYVVSVLTNRQEKELVGGGGAVVDSTTWRCFPNLLETSSVRD